MTTTQRCPTCGRNLTVLVPRTMLHCTTCGTGGVLLQVPNIHMATMPRCPRCGAPAPMIGSVVYPNALCAACTAAPITINGIPFNAPEPPVVVAQQPPQGVVRYCAECKHWNGGNTSYLGVCSVLGRRVPFDESCPDYQKRIV